MAKHPDGTRKLFDDGRGITATDGQSYAPATTESGPVVLRPSEQIDRDLSARLEYLRGELRAERISYGELVELESLVPYIPAYDVELLEAAGVPEAVPVPENHSDPSDHSGEMEEAGYPEGH